jgi:hypothetical protein
MVAFPLPGQEGFQMAGNNTVKNCRFRIAGHISPNAFTDGEVRFRGPESIIPGRIFL